MAFMTLKQLFSKIKKKHFNFAILVPFIVCLLPSLVNYSPNMTLFLPWKSVKRDFCRKSIVFKEFVMNLLAWTRVFHKK